MCEAMGFSYRGIGKAVAEATAEAAAAAEVAAASANVERAGKQTANTKYTTQGKIPE